MPAAIPGGGTMTFTWTFTASDPGDLAWTTTVTAQDGNSGAPLAVGPVSSATAAATAGAVLEAAVSVAPAPVSVGQWFQVFLTVTNVGTAAATGVLPGLSDGSTAPLVLVGGPVPPGPLSLAPGESITFAWTYSPGGAGDLAFGASVTGTGASGTLFAATAFSAPGGVETPAALSAALSLSATSGQVGDTLEVVLTVTNAGSAAATVPAPPDLFLAGPATATVLGAPAGFPAAVPGGGSVSWTWTVRLTGPGSLRFSASVAGSDANAGWPVAAAASAPLPVAVNVGPRLEVVSLTAGPGSVQPGDLVTVVLTVNNTGDRAATGVAPTVPFASGGGAVELLSGPSPASATSLDPGGTVSFTWTYRATAPGPVSFSAGATAADAPASPLGVSAPLGVEGTPWRVSDVLVDPNPFRPGADGFVTFRRLPSFARVRVFTVAGESVRVAEADGLGEARWDGRNDDGTRVKPAVYFFAVETADGRHRARGKIQIER
jgi:hypothetical protein